ncbi:MAG TPA: FHA domain-containing serine/threonine-protein kinase [Planctomycetaceae bacterium]|nr:FHA domain-containing serine/threonine-protein kinase [Planctomycetaceae bacterium]
MATAAAVEAFWNQLAESRLLSAEQLAALRQDRIESGAATEADLARRLVQRKLLSQYQADRLLDGRARGFFFDQYKIVDILGVGGMGWVYQAEDTTTGQTVALKVLQDQLKHDAGMHARFVQEARVGLRLQHPHIVRTYYLGSAGGLPYMVMEFVRGPSLLEVLQRCGPVKWPQACEFARQAALGLDFAHHAGIVHRDVKPQNLLIDDQGHVRLLDFGLSMVREGETGDEFSMAMIFGHESVGTAEFSAPEQSADSLLADARSDVYSLGGTLYTTLTGTTPYQAKSMTEMLRAHRTERLRSPREIVPSIPEGVANVVMKMLAKLPDDRYATAADAAAALAEWAKPGPVSFHFGSILAERQKHAQEKLAQLSKARSTPSGLRGSTARPTTISSATAGGSATRGRPASPSGAGAARNSGIESAVNQSEETSPLTPVREHRRAGQPIDSPAVLTSLDNGGKIPLGHDQVVLGRGDDSDVRIPSTAVSSRHCELRFDGFHWWISDLNSRNGTQVNGAPVKQQMLNDGDVILLGNSLRYRFDETGFETATKSNSSGLALRVAAVLAVVAVLIAVAAWWLLSG